MRRVRLKGSSNGHDFGSLIASTSKKVDNGLEMRIRRPKLAGSATSPEQRTEDDTMSLLQARTCGWKRIVGGTLVLSLVAVSPGWAQQTRLGGSSGSAGSSSSGGFVSSSGSSGLSGGSFGSGSLSSGFSLGGSMGSPGASGSQSNSPFISRPTGNTGTGSRTGTAGVATSNPFATYYINPFAAGLTGSTGKTFGSPLFTITNTTGLIGGVTATLSTSSAFGPFGTNPSPYGRRSPTYVTVLGFDRPEPIPSEFQSNLQQVVARSTKLPSNATIRVVLDGDTVVLRGSVANERERRMAENLIRLSPGVRQVRNELILRLEARAATPPR